MIGASQCDFTDAGTIGIGERVITPEEFQVNLELCKKDYRNDWDALAMGVGAHDNLPPNFESFIIGEVAAKVAEKTEQNIWGGVNATTGEFDGFTVLMGADANVNDATTSVTAATGFTSGNVVSQLEALLDVVPSAVYGREDLTLYVPTVAFRAYIRSLGGFGASGLGAAGTDNKGSQWYNMGNALSFDGVRIFHAPGMPADHMVAGEASNLYFGTGLLGDHNEVKVIDMADIDGSQNVRVIMRFTAGVQYGIGSDLALLTLV